MESRVTRLIHETNGVKVEVDAAMLKQDLRDRKRKDEDDVPAPKRWAGKDGTFKRLIRTRRQLTVDAVAFVGTRSLPCLSFRVCLAVRRHFLHEMDVSNKEGQSRRRRQCVEMLTSVLICLPANTVHMCR